VSAPQGRLGPLLVVVDMQHVFGDPGSPWATPGFDGLIEPIEALVAASGGRFIFTRFVLPDRIEGSWKPYYETWVDVTRPERAGWFQLAEPWGSRELATLDESRFSKWGSELEALAGSERTLVLCGVATDCCVVATAIAAADAGMYVRVVADACRGIDEAAHARAIELMAGFVPHIEITSVGEELRGRSFDASRTA
jgi:nicotinamidase-related amidase